MNSWLRLAALLAGLAAPVSAERLDDGSAAAAWQVIAAEGVEARLTSKEGVLELAYDFHGHAGYVVIRRRVELSLPPRWVLDLRLRGQGPRNNFELKLLDPTLDNVWWVNRRRYALPAEWLDLRTRGSRFEFAWGPAGGGQLKQVAAIELAIAAGEGGRGRVELDQLDFVVLPPPTEPPPLPRLEASSEIPGFPAARALDGDLASGWRSGPGASRLALDLGEPRELGGLLLRWPAQGGPREYEVAGSLDGASWRTLHRFRRAEGEVDAFLAPELEARYLRLDFAAAAEAAPRELREIELLPSRFGEDPNLLISRLAALAPRGDYPRAFSGETAFWTVAGEDGGQDEALLNEDGAIEPYRGAFSLEPFVVEEKVGGLPSGHFHSWEGASARPRLAPGGLPLPAVDLVYPGGVELAVETATTAEALLVRYQLKNRGAAERELALWVALRPFQVDPPWQFLSQQGGVTRVERLRATSGGAWVEGRPALRFSSAPAQWGAFPFEAGSLVARLRTPSPAAVNEAEVVDPDGLASAYFRWDFKLLGETGEVVVALPWPGQTLPAEMPDFAAARAANEKFWQERLGQVELDLPPAAGELAAVVKSALGHILIHRDGAAIQPGSRSYERSWIRDGALTSSALLRFGLGEVAREFLEYFAPYQFESGKVPCCVDGRGADPLPENDSGGQLIFLAHELWTYGGDRQLLEKLWPRLEKAVAYLDNLRQERRTEKYRQGPEKAFFGLLPESISHEGYSAKPMHSYWDDFWAHRGFTDAAELARALGKNEAAKAYQAIADEFAAELLASLDFTMNRDQLDYLPGCAELGDFDATSTAIALAPGSLGQRLPQKELRATFDRYYAEAAARFRGEKKWDAYTPYELRIVGALVRLGEKEKARQLLEWQLAYRRPLGWNQLPEVIFEEARAPRFNGDLPHGWVASELLRAVADLFAYQNESGDLELGAGIPLKWLESGKVAARGLATPWGRLELEAKLEAGAARFEVSGLKIPPGRAVYLHSPWGEREKVESLPATLRFLKTE